MVAWQSQYPFAPFDNEIDGSVFSWSGAILHGLLGLGTSIDDETNPTASSPLIVNDVSLRAVAWEHTQLAVGLRDIAIRMVDVNSVVAGITFPLSLTESTALNWTDQAAPDIDSDGVRIVVAYTDQNLFRSFDTDVRVTTVAVLPDG